jgi:hypothetical protein
VVAVVVIYSSSRIGFFWKPTKFKLQGSSLAEAHFKVLRETLAIFSSPYILVKFEQDILIAIDFRAVFAGFSSITTLLSSSLEVARVYSRTWLKGT